MTAMKLIAAVVIGTTVIGQVTFAQDCPRFFRDYYGNDVDTKDAETWSYCGELCEAEPNCSYWSYDPTGKKCWLKDSNNGDRGDGRRISGSRGCTRSGGNNYSDRRKYAAPD